MEIADSKESIEVVSIGRRRKSLPKKFIIDDKTAVFFHKKKATKDECTSVDEDRNES